MNRLLFWLGIAMFIVFLWRRGRKPRSRSTFFHAQPPVVESLVACAYCGALSPSSLAVKDSARSHLLFCNAEHRILYRKEHG